MKYILFIIMASMFTTFVHAQDNLIPSPPFKGTTYILNGTVHVGNGQVLQNTTVVVKDGKISSLLSNTPIPEAGAKTINAAGKQVYPGFILCNSVLGLREIAAAVRGSNDYREIGEINPNVRSIAAYNTDSKIIPTLRSNGILLAQVAPEGSLIRGTSSIVQLDAWTWEDAVYKLDDGIHVDMPSLLIRTRPGTPPSKENPLKRSYDRIETLKQFFREAQGYLAEKNNEKTNLKFEAVRGLFDQTQTLYLHCELAKEMLVCVDFAREFRFKICIVGGSESFQIAPLLKENNISVILEQVHRLPTSDDDDVDQPFKTPAVLQKAGVLYCITDIDDNTTGRNLSYNAGTAVANGLTKEQALEAITLSPAKILGIDKRTGSIEIGKDANIIISTGDVLDMRTSYITDAMIQGRIINLDDKQKQLYRKYDQKYGSTK